MSAPGQAEPLTPIPRWVAPLFAIVGIGLVPWTAWIAYDLPQRHLARHWDVAWGGFDAAMAACCWRPRTRPSAARRGSRARPAAAATMLVCDAWFDMATASRGGELAMAIASALLLELPLAVICLWVARNVEHYPRAAQAARTPQMTTPPPMLRRRARIRSMPASAHIASTESSGCRAQNPSMLGPRKRPVSSHPGPAAAPASGRPTRV